MHCSKSLVAVSSLLLCLNGCTTYQSIEHTDGGKTDGHALVRSSCSDFAFQPGNDIKVGDDVRFQTCDGRSASMTVTEFDARHIRGNNEAVPVEELASLEVKKLSLWKTALYGITGGTVAVASVALLLGVVLVSALPHMIVSALTG